MSSIQYYQTIIKNEAANCITQVAAFSFLTNYLINYSKWIICWSCLGLNALDVACLFQTDDIQRAGWNLYRCTILLCSYVVFYRIDVGRIIDGVLLQTVLG